MAKTAKMAKILTVPIKKIGASIHTLSILRINPPMFGGGLKFEPDAGIGQKGEFCKGA